MSAPPAPGPAPAVALVGTTASGKSSLAMSFARRHRDVEILCVDSMTVYRGMDVGTAKPSRAERAEVPHRLLDLAEPSEAFTVRQFQVAARAALAEVAAASRRALLVGGTGLYLRAVVDDLEFPGRYPEVAAALEREADAPGGLARLHRRLAELDPVAADRTTAQNRRRIVRALEVTVGSGRPFSGYGPGLGAYPPSPIPLVGLSFDPAVVDARIETRVRRWMDAGLLEEVRALAACPAGLSRTAAQALGYKELLAHVADGAPLEPCVEEVVRRTRSFARRQWAWFRRDPRIRWVERGEDPLAVLESAFEASVEPLAGASAEPAAEASVGSPLGPATEPLSGSPDGPSLGSRPVRPPGAHGRPVPGARLGGWPR